MRRTKALLALAALGTASMLTLNAPFAAAEHRPAGPPDPQLVAASAADRHVAGNVPALFKSTHDRLTRHEVHTGAGGLQYVSYERTYRGLPVVGGDAVVVTDAAGKVLSTHAAQKKVISVGVTPGIGAAAARTTSRAELARVDEVSTPQLVIHAWGNPRLAWETVVTGATETAPSRLHVFVDANSGVVFDTYDDVHAGTGDGFYNGNVTIATSRSGSSYSMTDPNWSNTTCGRESGGPLTSSDDNWGNGSGTDIETACVDAMYAIQKMSDMLQTWLGRNGIDGQGGGFPMHVGLNFVNAYWDGSSTNYGRSQDGRRQLVPMDVVGHENGHAVFSNTPGGAGNAESGLNEGTGDIFGALTEAYANNPNDPPDYLVGEEADLVGDGPIRNMYHPSLVNNDPNCYSSSIPNTEEHAAAGPLNHWFYLAAEGSNPGGGKPNSPICSGGPSSVTGIGVQNAGKVFFNAMLRKTSSWTYRAVRFDTLTVAKQIFSGCTEFNRIKDAWNAVSVPAQSNEPTCTVTGNDFSIAVTPSSGSVNPGSSTSATVNTQTTNGSAQTVSLSATGLPSGANASFNPPSVTSGNSSTMTISTSGSTPTGTYTVTIRGAGSSATHTTAYTLTVGGGGPGPGVPDINVNDVLAHLQQFQTIANSNGGNRHASGSGYDASADYVFNALSAAGYNVARQNCTSGCTSGSGPNIIADWPGGDTNQVLMLGAHLDSVSAGPGINDNASGSGMLLEVALTLAERDPTMAKHVRFAWWTDEEQGLNGSDFYVRNLSSTERSRIYGYLNFDMVASTNGGYFINRINSDLGQTMSAYYDSIGIDADENTEGVGRSDDASFNAVGIETSGVAAGASARKTSTQAQKWGGTANQPFDSCYHQSCDRYPSNISSTVLDRAADATAYALWTLAVGTPQGNDFSIAVSPTSGSVDPGGSTTATVRTAVTSGGSQTVALSARGLPSGATASFSPSSVNAGGSSTMTIRTSASTPAGTYPITITGTGPDATRSTSFTLTVNGSGPGGGCDGYETTVDGTVTSGGNDYQPKPTGYLYVYYSGQHEVCLDGPDGADFDVYLQKWSGYSWDTVAQGTSPEADETFTYTGTAGYYRYRIHAYSGSGSYTLGYNTP